MAELNRQRGGVGCASMFVTDAGAIGDTESSDCVELDKSSGHPEVSFCDAASNAWHRLCLTYVIMSDVAEAEPHCAAFLYGNAGSSILILLALRLRSCCFRCVMCT